MLGTSFGSGMVVYKIVKTGPGPADRLRRIELGRSRFRYPTSPAWIPCISNSLR